MRDRPDARTLSDLAERAAAAGVAPDAVALARAIVARERAAGDAPVAAWAARLALLCDAPAPGPEAAPEALERRLAVALRAGAFDRGPERDALRAHLIATVRAKLAELAPALIATWPLLDEADAR
jgi:hypothetical protein